MPRKRAFDLRSAEVEKWKLTPEQLQFLKDWSDLRDVEEVLRRRTEAAQQDAADIRDLWMMLEAGSKILKIPKNPVREFPEMNFEEEEQSGVAKEKAPRIMPEHPWTLKY